ncbi:hypothetical protein AAAA53_23455, partial [Escherichia coli]|uniref:hypothetical protein n=1 Tax=Escherichia coli TaxID=562 RepID=UPI0034D95F73
STQGGSAAASEVNKRQIPRTKTQNGNDKGQKARFQHLSFPFFSGGILNKNIKLRRRRTETP